VLNRDQALVLALLAATLIAFYLCFQLALPFLSALAWAVALAIVVGPLHRRLERRFGPGNLSAGLAVAVVVLVVLGPLIFIIERLASEAVGTVLSIQEAIETGRWRQEIEKNQWLADHFHWLERQEIDFTTALQRVAGLLARYVPAIVGSSIGAGFELGLALFALFFFFRDRAMVLDALRSVVPLSPAEADGIFARVTATIEGTIYGSLTVAAIQGFLGGLMFWILDLPSPLLWGVIMAVLATMPMLGTFLVWGPAAVILLVTGHWGKAVVLVAWGALAIAMIDNLLYPFLVGKRLRLHTLLVFFSMVGGVGLYGASGLIMGPVTLVVTDGLLAIWRRRFAAAPPTPEA
jgi:predicted PurR-regulated permease PerM